MQEAIGPTPAPYKPGVGAHICTLNIQEAEARRSEVQGYHGLHSNRLIFHANSSIKEEYARLDLCIFAVFPLIFLLKSRHPKA